MNSKNGEKHCKTCKFYQVLGIEDSGLPAMFEENWKYDIGRCMNKKSVHGDYTYQAMYYEGVTRKSKPSANLANWNHCCWFKRNRGRQIVIDPDTAELARERVRNTQPPLFVLEQPKQLELLKETT